MILEEVMRRSERKLRIKYKIRINRVQINHVRPVAASP